MLNLSKYTSLKGWEVPREHSSVAPAGSYWSNKDMDPVPPEKRVWTWFSFTTMWVSDGFSPSTLQLAGAMISLGLSWRQAIGAVALGNILISGCCAANGAIAATLHTPFAVNIRASFGFYFGYFAIVTRLFLALLYTGTKSMTSAQGVHSCIRAIWPQFGRLPNALPASAGITSQYLIAYLVFWCIQTPLMMVSPARLRYLFLFKSIIGPIAGFICMDGGEATLTAPKLGWAFMGALNSAVGSYSTLSLNIGTWRSQMAQVIVIPVCFVATATMGVAIASGAYKVHTLSKIQFDPTKIPQYWSTDTSLERAALFGWGFAMALSNMGSNISANTLSAANDWTALVPKYLDIRRGSLLTAILGCWATAPWAIIATASGFLTLLGGYTLLSAPIWAIMVCDYYIVKKRKIDLPALYDPRGRYKYNRFGTNWRALAVLLIVVPPELPGLLHAISKKVPLATGNANFYKVAWLFGTSATLVLYPLLNYLFPSHDTLVERMIWTHDDDEHQPGGPDDEEKSLEKSDGADASVVPVV
ncbi:hypothetical protein JCM10213v2_006545 [Rhodosporidiobolus nylandii]